MLNKGLEQNANMLLSYKGRCVKMNIEANTRHETLDKKNTRKQANLDKTTSNSQVGAFDLPIRNKFEATWEATWKDRGRKRQDFSKIKSNSY